MDHTLEQRIADLLTGDMESLDPEVALLAGMEEARQDRKLVMIASESLAPFAVREAVSSVFTNLYAEGYPPLRMVEGPHPHRGHLWFQEAYQKRYGDRRYYKGVDVANYVEALAIERAKEAFATKDVPASAIWANVQPLSGAAANNAVYEACLSPGDTVMGLDLTHGGHLTHGHPLNRSGIHHDIVHYEVDAKTGRLDYDRIIALAEEKRPRLIIAGYSAYPWAVDWAKFREAADRAGATLLADIAHVAGLVAAGVYPSPVGFADAITFTTHKSLMGPRGAVILTTDRRLAASIDRAVFPGEQGGPHVNQIAAKALVLGLTARASYRKLQKQVVDNAARLAASLEQNGMTLAYGGTDTHMLLVDLRPIKGPEGYPLTGEILSRVLDLCGLSCNKNTIAGDSNAAHPSAIRLGTPWVTQRGMRSKEMDRIAAVVAKVAKAIRPFSYTDAGGEIGRGKIDFATQAWAKDEIANIVSKFSAYRTVEPRPVNPLEELYRKRRVKMTRGLHPLPARFAGEEKKGGTVLVDRSDGEVFTVSGDPHRVRAFLSQLTTCDVFGTKKGACTRGFAIGENGALLADVALIHLDNDAAGLARWKVIAGPSQGPRVHDWFAAISAGYTLFDETDLTSKVEGPILLANVIGEYPLTLVGEGAAATLAAAVPEAASLVAGAAVEIAFAGAVGIACRFDLDSRAQIVQVAIDEDAMAALWETLASKKTGCQPVGTKARDALLGGLGVTPRKDATVADLPGFADPATWTLDKPYCVGMRLLQDRMRDAGRKRPFHWEATEAPLKRTCLYDRHAAIARKNYMVPFAGWEMPVRYGNILDEHRAVREAAGLFDVSHMGVVEVSGRGATAFLDLTTTNYVPWLLVGHSHYSYVLDPDGNVLDDVMVYRRGDEKYMVVVNAANFDKVFAYLNGVNRGEYVIDNDYPSKKVPQRVRIRDLKEKKAGKAARVDMALQGPVSREVLLSLIADKAAHRVVRYLNRGEFIETKVAGKPAIVSGTGYTGEPEAFELYVHPDDAPAIWDAILDTGEPFGVKPCGLGARDSLRTEAGLPLYGHELAGPHDIGPGGAGYGAFVKLHKPFFVGKAAYIANECRRAFSVIRFAIPGKGVRPVRAGDLVLDRNGTVIGHVTSSASVEDRQVGLAYVKSSAKRPGTAIAVTPPPKDGFAPEVGARLPVPVAGTIVDRFLRKEGKHARSGDSPANRPVCGAPED